MITTKQMYELEKNSKVPLIELMENSGKAVADEIKKRFKDKLIVIICSHGNNGGDGFVAARYLNAKVIFVGKEEKLTSISKPNYEKIKSQITEDTSLIEKADVLIDAIFGTGVKGKIKEPLSSIIDLYNKSKEFKVAIDIPTGLDPDTGEILDKLAIPDLIITMHDIKPGLEKFKDKTIIKDIGLK